MDKLTFTNEVLAAERTLYRVSKSILLRESDCEDAVQSAVLKAYEKLDTLKDPRFFKTWLVRIVIHECYNLRRFGPATLPYEDCSAAAPSADYSELYQAIRELRPRIRVTVVLHYLEGYSVEEIKEILKIPSGTVKSRLSTGRALLKSKLEPRGLLDE